MHGPGREGVAAWVVQPPVRQPSLDRWIVAVSVSIGLVVGFLFILSGNGLDLTDSWSLRSLILSVGIIVILVLAFLLVSLVAASKTG